MKRVLVAVDGSEAAVRAARMGADLAGKFGAKVMLVYVVPRLLLPPDVYGLTVEEVEREQSSHGQDVLRSAVEALSGTGVDLESRVLSGPPAETLAEAAAGADLVVVGSRGQGAVKRMLLGSVSDRLVHICPCPILVVH
jgi:nucleotide-binding universal stress UspA family protein